MSESDKPDPVSTVIGSVLINLMRAWALLALWNYAMPRAFPHAGIGVLDYSTSITMMLLVDVLLGDPSRGK